MSDRRVFYLIVIFGILFSALFLFSLISLPSKREALAEGLEKRDLLEQKQQRLSSLLSTKGVLTAHQDLLRQALPEEDAIPTLMTQIEGLGRLSGVTVSHLGFSVSPEEEPKAGTPKVSLTVVITGSQPALQTFLTNLEHTSRLIAVTNLRFSQALEEGLGGEVSSTLGVSAYYLPVEESTVFERAVGLDLTSESFTSLMTRVESLRVHQPVEETVEVGKEDLFE